MALDPIGTPRRNLSLATTHNGWNSNTGSRAVSGAATPVSAIGGAEVQQQHPKPDAHMQSFLDRYQFMRNGEAVKNELIEELLFRYNNLRLQHEELKQTSARNEVDYMSPAVEHELQTLRDSCNMYQSLLHSNPYVMALIDGDGMIFNNELLRLGHEGGRKAAYQLQSKITKYIRDEKEPGIPTEFKVVARVYANVRGLADTLVRAGVVSSATIFEDFVSGFTRGHDLCDFIDVGSGKDRADIKISANFRVHINDWQCRQILFGCSHDNGYARLLENYLSDDNAMTRVTLLEGVPFERELAALPFEKTKLSSLFRDSKIALDLLGTADLPRLRHDSRNMESKNIFNPASAIFTPPTQSPAPTPSTPALPIASETAVSSRGDLTRTNSINSVALSEGPPGLRAVKPPAVTTPGSGWATVAAKNASKPLKDIKKSEEGPTIFLNEKGMRIDKKMDYDHNAVYELKQKKLCNQHYIGRGCCHHKAANKACPHRHDYPLSKDGEKWLRIVARETVCKKGTGCLEFDCIYGHHCPYPRATEGTLRGSKYCINGEKCRFADEMHGMDTRVAKVLRPEDVDPEGEYLLIDL